jgi:NAD(P)-dependent dehydrogenase (short-subunit alcohol dehydrogenase family)
MSETSRESGRTWFVTGASSGFGQAIGRAVLDAGDRLVATARDVAGIEELVEQDPDRVLALPLDVTDAAAARAVVAKGRDHFGRLDVVVNNAGYGHIGAVEELTDAEWREQLNVNLDGVIHVTRAALPWLRQQGSGHFVQMSSLNGVEALPGGAYYVASKFAVEGFSESLAAEVAHLGIKVTIVEPGPHRTRFANERSAKWAEPMPEYAPSVGQVREAIGQLDGNQLGDPDRAARAIIEAVNADEPPLRLPLGTIALDNIRAKLTKQLADLETWADLSASSDLPAEQ